MGLGLKFLELLYSVNSQTIEINPSQDTDYQGRSGLF